MRKESSGSALPHVAARSAFIRSLCYRLSFAISNAIAPGKHWEARWEHGVEDCGPPVSSRIEEIDSRGRRSADARTNCSFRQGCFLFPGNSDSRGSIATLDASFVRQLVGNEVEIARLLLSLENIRHTERLHSDSFSFANLPADLPISQVSTYYLGSGDEESSTRLSVKLSVNLVKLLYDDQLVSATIQDINRRLVSYTDLIQSEA